MSCSIEAVQNHQLGRRRAEVRAQPGVVALVLMDVLDEPVPLRLGELELRPVTRRELDSRDAFAREEVLELRVLLEIELLVAELHLVERRHGDVHVAGVDQVGHLPVEEREDQRADVRAVDVGVRHHDHAVIAELLEVELLAEAGAERGDHRLDLVVRENLPDAVLLAVDDLPAQRQDRLVGAVAAHLRRAAGAVAFDDEELRSLGILDRAVGELAWKRHRLERRLPPGELARLARRLTCALRRDRLVDDLARVRRVLLEELRELLVDRRRDEPASPTGCRASSSSAPRTAGPGASPR